MVSRREVLKYCGLTAVSAALPALPSIAHPTADYRLEIAPFAAELSPRHTVKTVAYNGQVPGPLLRFKEGRAVTIEVANHSDRPEVVHWHGLLLPPEVDGAMEEGTPPILPMQTVRYRFMPRPAGFRWYHTHTMAMGDLTRGQYGGQHGPLLVEARDDPGHHDNEFCVVLHDWRAHLLGSEDGAMNLSYAVSTINGKVMGFGEPLRVARGQRVIFHMLNASATDIHWVALSGHRMQVIALDGNAVPEPQAVAMLRLAPAERVCVRVEMDNPGVWVLGEVRKHVRAAGMAIVVEYANQRGAPQWQQLPELVWNYELFADPGRGAAPSSVIRVPLVIESKFRGHGAMEAWTLNGRSYPEAAIEPLVRGARYRLQFINRSRDDHPLHLHRHSFELCTLGAPLGGGVIKDVVLVDAQSQTDIEFTADNPGATLLHCHQQNHMDLGFMMLLQYA